MGKKKHKETGAAVPSQNDIVSTSSDIFKTLFGQVDQDAGASSIFSDSNPFKRKPEESISDPVSVQFNKNPKNGGVGDPNGDELKMRKRNKEQQSNVDQDSIEGETTETPLVAKKSKKVKTHSPNLGADTDDGEEKPEEIIPNENKDKKRKKRKRDVLEEEYEARKYGATPEDEANKVVVGQKRKKADNAADLLVSKEVEGFDDESKLTRTVFVGNLPLKVKKKVLIKEFSRFGEIESVRIRSVPVLDTKIPRKGAILQKQINETVDSVHAYIVFRTEQSAGASLAHNMSVVGGNHIRVDRACPPRKKLKGEDSLLYDNKRTVFVGNLPFDVKDEEIYQLFSGIKGLESSIEAIRVIRHPHIGLGKGIAYLLFKTREAANLLAKKKNLKLRDRELRLSHARKDSTPSKRRNPFPAEMENSPSKKLAVGSRTPDHKSASHTKAPLSYQGLHASKSDVRKKVHQKRSGTVKVKSNPHGEIREVKRPAVAARKARAKALKDGGASKQAGKKRKLDGRTPEKSNPKKKARKLR